MNPVVGVCLLGAVPTGPSDRSRALQSYLGNHRFSLYINRHTQLLIDEIYVSANSTIAPLCPRHVPGTVFVQGECSKIPAQYRQSPPQQPLSPFNNPSPSETSGRQLFPCVGITGPDLLHGAAAGDQSSAAGQRLASIQEQRLSTKHAFSSLLRCG